MRGRGLGAHQVGHADSAAGDLIGEAGANALARGANGMFAPGRLVELVDDLVPRHDELRAVAHHELARVDPARFEAVNLLEQDLGVHRHAVTDDASLLRIKDASRHQVQLEFAAFVHDGVPRVIPGGIASNDTSLAGEEVDDPALAFVAPLPADNNTDRHGGHTPGLPLSGEAR
jgi:hypothetical protein